MENSKYYWVWLSRIEGLGCKRIISLLEKYKNPENIWKLKREELQAINGIGKQLAEKILDEKYKTGLDTYMKYIEKNNIDIITILDKDYPDKLKNIYDPPAYIYVKGNKDILNKFGIAIVGCRLSSTYGEKMAKSFAYNLAKYNINIISGLARGIDTCAHIGALQANGNTIAVLGNGLDSVYPAENKGVFEKIVNSGGAIISEYVIGTKPEKSNFPARNRIISGLSEGVILIEAKRKSGSMITVDCALEQGRNVFAIPR